MVVRRLVANRGYYLAGCVHCGCWGLGSYVLDLLPFVYEILVVVWFTGWGDFLVGCRVGIGIV